MKLYEIAGASLQALASVSVCASSESNLMHLTMVSMHSDGQSLAVAATDRFRLAEAKTSAVADLVTFGPVNMLAKEFAATAKQFAKSQTVTVSLVENAARDGEVMVEFTDGRQTVALLNTAKFHKFPERYEQLIPARLNSDQAAPTAADLNVDLLASVAKLKPVLPKGQANRWQLVWGEADVNGFMRKPLMLSNDSGPVTFRFVLMPMRG